MEKIVRNVYNYPFTAATTGMHWSHGGQSLERKFLELGYKWPLFTLLLPEGHDSLQESQNFRIGNLVVILSSRPQLCSLESLLPSHARLPAKQV